VGRPNGYTSTDVASILIVCTGNICRSPMAEGLLLHHLQRRGIEGVSVASAGVSAWDGSYPVPEAVAALEERGLDISHHLARRLARDTFASADLILAMAAEHRDAVASMDPGAASRTFTIKELAKLLARYPMEGDDATPEQRLRRAVGWAHDRRSSAEHAAMLDEDVADPLGLGLESFRATAWELDELCEEVVGRIFGGVSSSGPSDRHLAEAKGTAHGRKGGAR
jgi:protein-tyrosine phosphatase